MRTYLDCYPCFLRQALEAARRLEADEPTQKLLLDRVLDLLEHSELSSTPPQIGDRIHRLVRSVLGNSDPYRSYKEEATRQALELYPSLKELLADADNPLETAVRLSIAGNIIDAGPDRRYELRPTVQQVLCQPFALESLEVLRAKLARAPRLLFLADNAAETVFDRLLIESLEVPVIYAVKGGPIVNDATMQDARAAGIDRVAELISTGSDALGTILEQCSEEFHALYRESELVIAKGQANYETLSEEGSKVFFLLQAKCPVIARDLGVAIGGIVAAHGGRRL
jgi:uncharacterized protein with ATP-grasp and redox domains